MANARDLDKLQDLVQSFCESRDWDQFHGPKELAIGIVTEAAELLEQFRFLSAEECEARLAAAEARQAIEEELADVLFFLLRFAQRYEIHLGEALVRKMQKNAARYPVEKARGRNLKSTEL